MVTLSTEAAGVGMPGIVSAAETLRVPAAPASGQQEGALAACDGDDVFGGSAGSGADGERDCRHGDPHHAGAVDGGGLFEGEVTSDALAEYVDNNLLTEDSDVLAGIQIKTYVAHGGDDGGAGGVYFDGQGGSRRRCRRSRRPRCR